jgi:hypothetical protein
MAIAKNPKRYQSDRQDPDRVAEQFIAGAGTPVATAEQHSRKTPTMIRFDPNLLKRVDVAAKRRGVSRSSWIQYVISKMLDEGEG